MSEETRLPIVEVGFTGDVELDIPDELLPIVFDGVDITGRLWELAGAFDGSILQVRKGTIGTDFGKVEALKLKVQHPKLLARPMQRWIYRVDDGSSVLDVIENVEFYLKAEYQGQGIGKASLITEALAANDLKFDRIVAIAAGSPSDRKNVGWRVWPKLGYDTMIPSDILGKMPPDQLLEVGLDPGGEIRISDLIAKGLYDLWEVHGEGCMMELDVSSLDTWSMKQLAATDEE